MSDLIEDDLSWPAALGRTVRAAREASGLSRAELSALSGVGTAVLYRFEQGRASTRLDTVSRVLAVLNLTLRLDGPGLVLLGSPAPLAAQATDTEALRSHA